MNTTQFKEKVLTLNLNKAEIKRIKNLTTRSFKYDLRMLLQMKKEEVTENNFKMVWNILNQQMAKEDKFHRIQTHSMRNCKEYIEYGHLAYNGVADDF